MGQINAISHGWYEQSLVHIDGTLVYGKFYLRQGYAAISWLEYRREDTIKAEPHPAGAELTTKLHRPANATMNFIQERTHYLFHKL